MIKGKDNKAVFGYAFIFIGIIVLFEKVFGFHLFDSFVWGYIWPLLVILLGVFLAGKK